MQSTTPLRFPRCAHLRASAEFQAVFGEGKRVSGPAFRLHVLLKPESAQARLGVTVSKRVDANAVGRNRLRRHIKECFRLQRPTLPAGDYVLLAKPEARTLDGKAVRAEVNSLFERVRRLPLPALNSSNAPALNAPTPNGTMPPSDAPTRHDPTNN
jgi:ribonuclease P protein component